MWAYRRLLRMCMCMCMCMCMWAYRRLLRATCLLGGFARGGECSSEVLDLVLQPIHIPV